MIVGLPWTAWLLLLASAGIGLTLALTSYLRYFGASIRRAPGREGE